MFTHVRDAHETTSWLDHVLCSQDMQTKLHSIAILDMLPALTMYHCLLYLILAPLQLLTKHLHVSATKLILTGQ